MVERASFTYFGSSPDKNKLVTFYRQSDGQFTVRVEGMPALTITHPSYERVKAAFRGFWEMAQKDWGPSEIEWGDM